MTNPVLVTPRDVAAAGLCISGARQWATARGVDFATFLKEGLSVDELREANCPLCNRACDQAEARAAKELNNGQQ